MCFVSVTLLSSYFWIYSTIFSWQSCLDEEFPHCDPLSCTERIHQFLQEQLVSFSFLKLFKCQLWTYCASIGKLDLYTNFLERLSGEARYLNKLESWNEVNCLLEKYRLPKLTQEGLNTPKLLKKLNWQSKILPQTMSQTQYIQTRGLDSVLQICPNKTSKNRELSSHKSYYRD